MATKKYIVRYVYAVARTSYAREISSDDQYAPRGQRGTNPRGSSISAKWTNERIWTTLRYCRANPPPSLRFFARWPKSMASDRWSREIADPFALSVIATVCASVRSDGEYWSSEGPDANEIQLSTTYVNLRINVNRESPFAQRTRQGRSVKIQVEIALKAKRHAALLIFRQMTMVAGRFASRARRALFSCYIVYLVAFNAASQEARIRTAHSALSAERASASTADHPVYRT